FTERRYFKLNEPQLVDNLRYGGNVERAIDESGMLRRQKSALVELLRHPEASAADRESMAVNIVAQEQAIYDNRIKVTDLIAKIAPMLGLMGTLIPLGPGIVGIGEGDTELLAESLLIAFDTTVLGLVVAAVALLVSTIRKAWYAKYATSFEAACECVLEAANEGAVASSVSGVSRPATGSAAPGSVGASMSAAPASAAPGATASASAAVRSSATGGESQGGFSTTSGVSASATPGTVPPAYPPSAPAGMQQSANAGNMGAPRTADGGMR
ncbi:MAG: MotA/TolQ/ExbB proton channel family protein, partial [Eggerthellaceae bacterium]|nr:MotA/TolQ/ExbB proton channel family protein [Eggerthellaceae bacterium]